MRYYLSMPGIQFVLPMIASVIQGMLGQGLAANQATNQRNEDIRISALRRKELQPIIDRLTQAQDYFGVEEQLVRDFSRASDQMAAQGAQTGMTNAGSGGLDANRSDLLGELIAGLAQFKMQNEAQNQAMAAELLSDPTLYDGSRTPGNAAGNTILGGLLGGVAGAGTQLSSYLSTPEGINILNTLGQSLANRGPGISANAVQPMKFMPDPSIFAGRGSGGQYPQAMGAQRTPTFGSWYLPFTAGNSLPQTLTR